MEWRKVTQEQRCRRCGKVVRPGRQIGAELGIVYCYRCGHNRELAGYHRLYGKQDSQAVSHLRAIAAWTISGASVEYQKGGADK